MKTVLGEETLAYTDLTLFRSAPGNTPPSPPPTPQRVFHLFLFLSHLLINLRFDYNHRQQSLFTFYRLPDV